MVISKNDNDEIEKFALQNAIKYNSIPQSKAVIGKIIFLFPHLKTEIKNVSKSINEIIENIKKDNIEVWTKKLKQLDPKLIDEIYIKKEPKKGLKELPQANIGSVIMRFAPNPNGPPTLGSSRGMIINTEYVKKYNGKFILRYDDTDPDKKKPMLEAYKWYLDDFKWLGITPDKIVYASERLDIYYKIAKQLIQLGKAYVCFCEINEFKNLKNNKIECKHRNQPIEKNIEYWENMLLGVYDEQEAVLRIRTDIENKDPALRDWGAFRIIKKTHQHLNKLNISHKYIVWPLLDFESAIEDHILGTTHIIRGKDLQDSGKRQKYIYDYLNWKYPITMHWGRVKIEEFGKLSTSQIKKSIENGDYIGWDDPKLPTIMAIRKRGIYPEALKKIMLDLGVGETDISISMESLYSENRKIVDPIANRYFFVWDPKYIEIINLEINRSIKIQVHPNNKNEFRIINLNQNKIYLCDLDVKYFFVGQKIRLRDLCNIEIQSLNPLIGIYLNNSLKEAKINKIKIIHWVPVNEAMEMCVFTPDKKIIGVCEPNIKNEINNVIQLERFGFCRVDSIFNNQIFAYYSHK